MKLHNTEAALTTLPVAQLLFTTHPRPRGPSPHAEAEPRLQDTRPRTRARRALSGLPAPPHVAGRAERPTSCVPAPGTRDSAGGRARAGSAPRRPHSLGTGRYSH